MNIPDPAVYAAIPVVGASIVWVGRQFIREQNRRDALDNKTHDIQLIRDNDDNPVEPLRLSARDWLNIVAAIEKQFNGRYWLASEARAAMEALGHKLDSQSEKLHDRISKLRDEINE